MPRSAADVDAVAERIESQLRAVATRKRAIGEKKYLKSELDFLGATMPDISRASKDVARAHPDLSRTRVLALARRLWRPGIYELRMAAVNILSHYEPRLTFKDGPVLERLIRQSHTWALVDPIAISVAGPLVARESSLADMLDRWATDDDFWIRRAALLALLKPLRAGGGDFDRFGRYADAMLEEREFFIRKAIGWVLRDTARTQPEVVAAWVGPRTHRMSGVTIREAVKRLPPGVAEIYLAAYRAGRPATTA